MTLCICVEKIRLLYYHEVTDSSDKRGISDSIANTILLHGMESKTKNLFNLPMVSLREVNIQQEWGTAENGVFMCDVRVSLGSEKY